MCAICPGCAGTLSSVHISWLPPQDSQIISPPWHGTRSTALGCLTARDIVLCVCVCVCLCTAKGSKPQPISTSYSLQTPQVPRHSSKLPLFVRTLYDAVDKHTIGVDTIEWISTINSCLRTLFHPSSLQPVEWKSMQHNILSVLCSIRRLNVFYCSREVWVLWTTPVIHHSKNQFTYRTLFGIHWNSFLE